MCLNLKYFKADFIRLLDLTSVSHLAKLEACFCTCVCTFDWIRCLQWTLHVQSVCLFINSLWAVYDIKLGHFPGRWTKPNIHCIDVTSFMAATKEKSKLNTHTSKQMLQDLQLVAPQGRSLTRLRQRISISCLQADSKRTSRATYRTSSAENNLNCTQRRGRTSLETIPRSARRLKPKTNQMIRHLSIRNWSNIVKKLSNYTNISCTLTLKGNECVQLILD